MKIPHPRNRVLALLAAAIGLATATTAPVQAQSLADMLDRVPQAGSIMRNFDRRNHVQRQWYGQQQWRQDRRDDGTYRHRRRGETEYERQMRGLYRPGYDIDSVLRNNYHGNRQ